MIVTLAKIIIGIIIAPFIADFLLIFLGTLSAVSKTYAKYVTNVLMLVQANPKEEE